jgi:hypothetical protein
MATLAIGLTIPMSILADVFWKHKTYEPLFVIGAVPMFWYRFFATKPSPKSGTSVLILKMFSQKN